MPHTPKHLKKLIWQVPAVILLLIAMGNIIMLFIFKDQTYTYTWKMFSFGAINSVLVGGTFLLGITWIVRVLDRRLSWLHFPLKRLIVQVLLTIGFSLVIIVLTILVTSWLTNQSISSGNFVDQAIFMMKISFIFLFLGTLLANAIMFFKNWKEAAVQQERLKREQLILQYETLKSQVNPHFLFNNLNSLTSLISTNPEKAIDFVKKLSEVYRYVLDQKNCELVDLETELKFVGSYVYLQQIRFGANLDVKVNVNARNFRVIPLSVQMLVENAIKHNEISERNPLFIHIYSTDEQYLVIENKLQKKANSEGSGSGIQNIKSRYEFFTEKDLIIGISKERFRVSIPLLSF